MIFVGEELCRALFSEPASDSPTPDAQRPPALRVPRCAAFVGGGGKTTAIERLARELTAGGHSAAITTTTRMYWPSDPGLRRLYAGLDAEEPGKMKGLPEQRRRALLKTHDCVLVEADGAKGRPLKFPRDFEPQIPPEAELVVLTAGLDGVGAALRDAVHCPELAGAYLGVPPDHAVTPADAAALLRVYEKKAAAQAPGARLVVLLNKLDGGKRRDAAVALAGELRGMRVFAL